MTYVQSLRLMVTSPFAVRKVEMTDDSTLYEVVTDEGERIGAAESPLDCTELCDQLNTAVAE